MSNKQTRAQPQPPTTQSKVQPASNQNQKGPAPSQQSAPSKQSAAQQLSVVGRDGFDPSRYVKQGLTAEDIIRIKECFDVFDYDRSGSITPNELKNAIIALGLDKSADEILRLVEDLDQDGNNQVDFEEFLSIFGFSGDIKDEDVLKDLFNQFDTDQNGLISIDDFQRINDLVGERYGATELKEMVEYADKDKDGFVNWDEFKSVVLKEYPTN